MKKSAWLRLALILVCAAMMLSLFACGGGEATETEGSSKAPETEAVEKPTESEKTEESETETEVETDTETETKSETESEVKTETKTETTAPQVDTTETETKEATTEKKVETTETEKKPVETTEKEKPTETTEKETEPVAEPDPLKVYIGPDKLAAASVNANRLDKGVVSADGSYVTYKNKADGGDGYVQVYGGGAVVSGQYLVIKYRYPTSNQTTATNIEIFSSTVNGGPTGGDNTRMPVKADGEWHLAVIDMAACKGEEKFPAGADGKYTVKYARFDVLDGNHVAGDSIDVAYAGITDDPAEVIALAKKEGVKTIDFTAASNKSETYYSSTGTTTPTPADVANVFIGPEQLASASVNTGRISGKEVSKDGSYATFTAKGTGGDGYALVLSGGAEVSGQYLIIKYRYPTTSKQTYLEIFASCTNAGPTGGDNIRFNVKTDGEWHVQVVDFADFNSKFTANEDGTYTVKYARVDLLDSNSTAEGETVDIAYVAFADDYQNVLKANGDSKTVDYRLGAEEIYSLYTSTGTELPAMTDVANKYFDAEDLAGKAPTGTNIGKVELSEDKSYVSIYGKGAGDGFFTVFSGNADVTGQYIIMKYRYPATNAEGYAPKARPLFAGNVMNGPTGGDTTGSFPVVADGEWHMTVFNVAAHISEEWLVANEDGTYTIKYLRFDIADGMPEDCCIDIQYIALTDDVNNLLPVAKGEGLYTVEARLTADGTVVYYPDTNSTEPPEVETESGAESEDVTEEETESVVETETQTEGEIVEIDPDEDQGDIDYDAPFFQFNIDFINDARSAGRSGVSAMYKDFAPYSTSAEGIIDLKGWFFGMSGVASYEFSIDGGATWIALPDTASDYTYGSDPNGIDKLIINKNTQLLGTPGFGVNANFRGGASLKINLSHLAHDEKVSITVSAVLNSGDRVEFLKLLDVFVACTHEDNTAEWTAIEGDIQRLASTCSACGKEVTKFIDYTTEGLKLAGAGYLASKKTMGGKTSVSLRQEANGMYYAHFEVTEAFTAENNLLVWSGSTIPNVDKFVAFLYRVNTNTSGTEMFISADSSLNGTHQNYPPIIVGGWQLAIVDCTSKTVWTKETGVWQLRLDLFNSRSSGYKVGDYADLAYLAFFSSKDAAIDFYGTYVDAYLGQEDCAHLKASGEWQWTGVEGEYKQKATCLLCEADVVRDCPHEACTLVPVAEKGETGELYESIVCNSCKYSTQRPVYYYNSIDAIYGGPDGTTVINPAERNNYQQTAGVNGAPVSGYLTFDATGKLIDKDKNPIQVTNIFSFSGWLGVNGGVDRYVYKINDGAWTTPSGSAGTVGADSGIGKAISGNAEIVDKTGSFKNASYQGKLKVVGMQEYADQTISITIGAVPANNPGSAEDPNVIILAVVNNLYVTCIHADAANEWVKADTEGYITCVCVDCGETITKVCDHSVMDIEWENDAKLYKGECVCGHTYENDVVYRSEAYVGAGAADSQNNFISAVKDGDVVRYTPTKSSGDPYFYPYRNGKAVTGKYMIIKYRLVNNGNNMTVSSPFASSVASGQGGAVGKNGDASNSIWGTTLYADGNWHYMVIIPNSGNNTFTANADGTYSWAYLRITTKSFAAYDGSCYLEIDEVAFVDNVNAAEYYAYSKDDKIAPFKLNLDDGNNTIDGGKFLGGTKATENASYAIDFSDKTLSTPKSLVIGGWLCTPGGVASYKYRVVSVNGETVAEPTLVNWGTPGYREDIYNAVGGPMGYSSACANGAGFKATLDFTAYEGKKINVEIVAVTNYGGAEVVIVVLNNLEIPCSHAGNTNEFAKKDGDMFRLAANCSDCGNEIYQVITTTTSGLRLWTPYELQNVKTSNAPITLRNEGGIPYIHIELGQDIPGEVTTQINDGTVSNVGSHVAFLYRRNDKVEEQMQIFIRSGSSWAGSEHKEIDTVAGKWLYIVYDLTDLAPLYDPASGLNILRLDTFNAREHEKGAAVDLGFVAFFNSAEDAWTYFEAYKEEYNVTGIENPYTINFDASNTKLNDADYIAAAARTHDTTIDIDYTGAVLNNAKSVTVGGWCVTPGGCANFSYYVIDSTTGTAVKSERKLLVVGANNTAAIRDVGLGRNFGESCGLGASTGGARTIDLTGYEGKTVSVQVVVCTNYGPEIVVSNLTNITVPAAE